LKNGGIEFYKHSIETLNHCIKDNTGTLQFRYY